MKTLQTMIANDIDATDGKTKYDTQVKKVLANKIILAWILKYTVKEFFQFTISDIEKCIEGKPEVAVVPMEAGLTNTEIITGSHTEDAIPNEGKITYDIRFYVILPDGEQTKIIINLEAQKDSEPGYDLVTRAVFYCARLLSAQLGKEFTNKTEDNVKYDGIKKVYSIWICMDSRNNAKDSIVEYHIQPNVLYGNPTKTSRYDLLSAVMINLGGDELISENRLVNMLTTLLSSELDKEKKKKKLQEEFEIPMSVEFEQEVEEMCNLSSYVEEKGRAEGREEGRVEGREEGKKEGELNIIILYNWLKESGREADAEAVMKPENEELRSALYIEYDKVKMIHGS